MKAPRFWFEQAGFKSLILSPLAKLYEAGSALRRVRAKPYTAKVPVICVGNVTTGGSGKTPTCIALGRLLKHEGANPAFVSRGYGGAETGPVLVNATKHTAHEVGDEALLLAKRAPCWVGKNKVQTIQAAETSASHIVMDDGFQNPTVAPDVSLLVIDGMTGLGNEKILPAGPLREKLEDAQDRATAIILIGQDAHNLTRRFTKPVFEARLRPHIPDDFPDLKPYFAFAGIGYPEKFFASCHEVGLKPRETRVFPDHHVYSSAELEDMARLAEAKGLQLLTTTKDWVRLPDAFKEKVAALQIEVTFRDPMGLLQTIQNAIMAKRPKA